LIIFTKYYYDDQIKKDEVGEAYRAHGEMRNPYKVLVGKPDEKGPFGRQRRRWEDNIKMYVFEIGRKNNVSIIK
jgi:hypothetical protein